MDTKDKIIELHKEIMIFRDYKRMCLKNKYPRLSEKEVSKKINMAQKRKYGLIQKELIMNHVTEFLDEKKGLKSKIQDLLDY